MEKKEISFIMNNVKAIVDDEIGYLMVTNQFEFLVEKISSVQC